MRPIAVLAAGPWCFPDAVVVSPGQGPMQRRLAGYDLAGAGRSARGHCTAAAAARTGGGAGGHAGRAGGAGAVEGGGCQRGGSR